MTPSFREYVYVSVRICVYVCVYMYACMCVCMCVCVYMWVWMCVYGRVALLDSSSDSELEPPGAFYRLLL